MYASTLITLILILLFIAGIFQNPGPQKVNINLALWNVNSLLKEDGHQLADLKPSYLEPLGIDIVAI